MQQPKTEGTSKPPPDLPPTHGGGETSANAGEKHGAEAERDIAETQDSASQSSASSGAPHASRRPLATHMLPTDRRLHTASLWLPCLEALFGAMVPAFLASLVIGPSVLFFVIFFVLLPTFAVHALRFFTLRYRVTDTELVIHSGLVFRRERRIPFDRAQEIEIRQNLVHRLLDLAKLEITTAGSDTQGANLSVLSKHAAEALKETIAESQREGMAQLPDDPDGARDNPPDFVCRLAFRDLMLGGLTSNLVASLGAILAAIIYFRTFLNWVHTIEQNVEAKIERRIPAAGGELVEDLGSWLPDSGPLGLLTDLVLTDTLPKSVALALLGLIVSVVTYVNRYHGFRLIRRGDLLGTSHGLLTYRRGSLTRDKIQALKLEEGLLRRWCGLASVRVDSAGDRREIDDNKKRDVLVPAAARATAIETARQAIPGLAELEPNWRRISRRAVMRGSKKGWLLTLLVMAQTYFVAGWLALVWLPAIPLIYFLNYQWYRHTGYWSDERHFLSRKGWLNRATVCLPIKNIQSVSVSQNWFDRRLNLATLSIDMAGQSNTGGGPLIRHVPVDEAHSIQRTLANRAADSQFTW